MSPAAGTSAAAAAEPDRMAAIRKVLAADPDTGPVADQIQIRPGAIWRIEGEVMSIAARRKAVRLVRRAAPDIDVEDAVRLARPLAASDEALAAAVRDALGKDATLQHARVLEPGCHPPPVDEPWVGAMAHDGIVYLGGWLDSSAERAVAEGIAWDSCACSDVVNLIVYEQGTVPADEEIHHALERLVERHPEIAGQPFTIEVQHGRISVRGAVADPSHRALLVSLCWFLPGVCEVEEQLDSPKAIRPS